MNRPDNRRGLSPLEVRMLALVVLASSSYPSMQNKDPQPIVAAWSLMLADFPQEILQAAVVKVCRESPFFPSVAQIVAAAREMDPAQAKLPTAAEAWEEVGQLLRRAYPGYCPVYSCELVKRAVQAIGWFELYTGDNPEASRAHFLKIYESMRNREKDRQEIQAVMQIAGVGDLLKALSNQLGNEKRLAPPPFPERRT